MSAAPPPGELRSWVLAMPPGEVLNSNDRDSHWSRRQEVTLELRAAAFGSAQVAKAPRHAQAARPAVPARAGRRGRPGRPARAAVGRAPGRARITAVFHPVNHQRRDPGNLYPIAKGYVDGLVEYGLLPDDDTWHVLGPDMRAGDLAVPQHRRLPALAWMELRVAELPPLAVLRCRSEACAREVAAGAPKLAPPWPDADLEHRARADGKTVILMFTDPGFLGAVTAWARTSDRLADPSATR